MESDRLILHHTLRGDGPSVFSTYVGTVSAPRFFGPMQASSPPVGLAASAEFALTNRSALTRLVAFGIPMMAWRFEIIASPDRLSAEVIEGPPGRPFWRRRIKARGLDHCTLIAEEFEIERTASPAWAVRWLARKTSAGHRARVAAALSRTQAGLSPELSFSQGVSAPLRAE